MIQIDNNDVLATEIAKALEPMIRRIIREEIRKVAEEDPDIFYLNPGTVLYEDLVEIIDRKNSGQLEFHSHEEVWGE